MKNPYANIPTSIWLLATVTLISRSGSMVLVFLPLYLTQQLGFDIIIAGQIISLYGLGQIAGAYSGGIFTDKLGSLKIQVLGFFLVGILYILLEYLNSTFTIMLCTFFIGIFTASIRPAIGGVLAGISYMWIFRLDGIANVLAALALWLFFKNLTNNTNHVIEASHQSDSATSAWKDRPFLIFLLLILLMGMCFFQKLNIYPLYLSNNYHLSTIEIGMIIYIGFEYLNKTSFKLKLHPVECLTN